MRHYRLWHAAMRSAQKCMCIPVITLDIFQTGVTYIRWLKWFPETGQIITAISHVTTRAVLVGKHPVPFPT